MHKEQCSYEEALKEAQKLGIAESDPKLDVEGYDSANKIVLIANKVFNESLSIKDVERRGITQITFDDIAKAKKDNKVIKLVGSGKMESGTCALRVAPEALEMDHSLSFFQIKDNKVIKLVDL
jgi:homoserine dehydrogenase